jgi:hypothetical protein
MTISMDVEVFPSGPEWLGRDLNILNPWNSVVCSGNPGGRLNR